MSLTKTTMTSDRELQERILAALDFDPLDAAAIGVTVTHGVVTLQGCVPTLHQKLMAERIANSTAGVRAVANDIEVAADPTHRLTDSAVAEAAANALMWYRAVAPNTVHVTVDDGWVTLTGMVADVQERGAAERAVRGLRGVRGVSNALMVARIPGPILPPAVL